MTIGHGSIIRRIRNGLGAQGFSQAVQIFIRLAEVPLLLSFWGTQLYGEWLMLAAIPAYLAIGDGGFAGAACRDMTIKSGAGNRAGALGVFQSTWLLLLAVSFVVFLLACGLVGLVPVGSWLGFTAMSPGETQIMLLLLVAHVLFGFQGHLLYGGFLVSGRYPVGMFFLALTQLLEFLALGLAVIMGGGPVQAATGYLAGKILGIVLMWVGQRWAGSWLKYGSAYASRSEIRRLIAPAFASLAFPLGNALNIQGMRLVVGVTLGPAAVAVFVPLRTLSRLVMQPRAIINQLIQPEMAMAYGAEDSSLFNRLFLKSCQIAFWGCLLVSLAVGVGAYWVFPVWTSGEVVMQWPVFALLIAVALVNSIWYTALMVPYATNRHIRIAVFYCLVYGVGAFVTGYFGAKFFGLNGVALSLLFVETIMAVIVIRIALYMAKVKMTEWVLAVFNPPFYNLREWLRISCPRDNQL